jgi:hypothetical protein
MAMDKIKDNAVFLILSIIKVLMLVLLKPYFSSIFIFEIKLITVPTTIETMVSRMITARS